MEKALIIIMALVFLACVNVSNKETAVKEDEKATEEVTNSNNCDFSAYLNDPKIPKYSKELINNTASYSDEPLSYFDNLKSKDKKLREYYFRAITNSYNIADGAYAEGLGYKGYEYVETETQTFASYFDNVDCFTDDDLNTWADIVMLELTIDGMDENNNPIVDDLIKTIKDNCNTCSDQQKKTIDKFALLLKDKWNSCLQNTN